MTKTLTSKKEKDLKRKQQHSEIERNRRIKVNKRFDQLRELVSKDDMKAKPSDFKLQVLDQTVEYIHKLQDELRLLKSEESSRRSSSGDINSPSTSTPSNPFQTDETIVADVLVSLSTPESPFTKLAMANKIPEDLTLPPSIKN
ncbi:hypothetical protein E3Q22_00037 [Wallemia mellicola]|uniref:BHLH domain-containing protein n=2 Tax=Wallemia mellicola TaxID=1708541 RepID=A0A4T0ND48_9BASI|nr:hypothetical protein WALSEDRAFT_67106 [Wallemia mellicola CBS 633.66]TIB74767.1 hypothetical protein E3Q24_00323 [Wallemia mellicola]EIM24281.1 hypothetical protein WALSEDRAFT_67106 [Wallemia mellicola CBS 633.66]TIB82754.1 hypothetical protein E3Q22_00037 [Wallemia mellicola]TIB94631.1 hypothetical protein E3Q19_00231 [Wallemia mellicola]TIC03776.1 hypothetical protein E3Q18_00035 [Wallemia mellicola]|eukprot:XP_006956094.1 hypothetical protein WALSEDRAFT_67106 [Wallemia mellicola CBS 633.66]